MIIFICMIFSSVKISKKILIIISMLSVALHSNDNYSTIKNYEKNFNSMTWINKSDIWWKVDFESLKVKIYQIHFDNISLTIKSHVAKFFGIWRAAVWNGAKQNRSAVKVHKPCFFIYSRYLHYMLQPEVS